MKFNFLLVLLVLLSTNAYCHGQSPPINRVDADLLGRFESEAPRAWQEAKEDYLRFFRDASRQCDGLREDFGRSIGKKKGNVKRHRWQNINLGEDYGILKGGLEDGASEETVALFNRSYYALLQRKKGSSDWLLKKIGELPEHDSNSSLSAALDEVDVTLFHAADPFAGNFHPYDENPLLEFTATENIRAWPELRDREIIGVEPVDYDGKEMVKVEMMFNVKAIDWNFKNAEGEYRPTNQPRKHTAIFDPAEHWCLREVAGGIGTNGNDVIESKKIFLYSMVNGVQICDGYIQTGISTASSDVVWRTEVNNPVTIIGLSPQDFTLSAFGLPEPDWYRPPTPWWMYTSLAGLAMVIVGAVLFRFGKKMV